MSYRKRRFSKADEDHHFCVEKQGLYEDVGSRISSLNDLIATLLKLPFLLAHLITNKRARAKALDPALAFFRKNSKRMIVAEKVVGILLTASLVFVILLIINETSSILTRQLISPSLRYASRVMTRMRSNQKVVIPREMEYIEDSWLDLAKTANTLASSDNISTVKPDETCRIIHLAKEYGPSRLGGVGTVLDTLTELQARSNPCQVYLITPLYSFLKRDTFQLSDEEYDDDKQSEKPKLKLYSRFKLNFNFTFLATNTEFQDDVLDYYVKTGVKAFSFPKDYSSIQSDAKGKYCLDFTISTYLWERELTFFDENNEIYKKIIKVIYIDGPEYPLFDGVFMANSNRQIYGSRVSWIKLWTNAYYGRVGALLLNENLFRGGENHPNSIVHAHGSSTTLTLLFWHTIRSLEAIPNLHIVYTLHDYSYEFQILVSKQVLENFGVDVESLEFPSLGMKKSRDDDDAVTDFIYFDETIPRQERESNVMYENVLSSGLGFLLSDKVTIVSKFLLGEVSQGREGIQNERIFKETILEKVESGQMYGITNGVYLPSLNPFDPGRELEELGVIYRFGSSIKQVKNRAKELLASIFPGAGFGRGKPIALFIGRYEYIKGIYPCIEAGAVFRRFGITFVMLGTSSGATHSQIAQLKNNKVVLVENGKVNRTVAMLLRFASDVGFVPSLSESFGLVAVESLLFGAPVIGSRVGGLKEFLVDRPRRPSKFPRIWNMPSWQKMLRWTDVYSYVPSWFNPAYHANESSIKNYPDALEAIRKRGDYHAFCENLYKLFQEQTSLDVFQPSLINETISRYEEQRIKYEDHHLFQDADPKSSIGSRPTRFYFNAYTFDVYALDLESFLADSAEDFMDDYQWGLRFPDYWDEHLYTLIRTAMELSWHRKVADPRDVENFSPLEAYDNLYRMIIREKLQVALEQREREKEREQEREREKASLDQHQSTISYKSIFLSSKKKTHLN